MDNKSKTLQVRITPDMMSDLSKKAESEGTKVSDYVRTLIEKDLSAPVEKKTRRRTYAI